MLNSACHYTVKMLYFRDNPNLGDGNMELLCSNVTNNLNFRDNPNLGDGNF